MCNAESAQAQEHHTGSQPARGNRTHASREEALKQN